ncbi:MAG: indolepyruvate ferredoxin oxidoreductase subunit alpha [Nitrospirota bacterium]
MKRLLSGNKAVATGAYEAGAVFASGYPGTPATEIIEHLVQYQDISACWAANEKIALEMASGASFAGKRSIVAMKHVGLNVASDPLMTLAYTGVRAGLLIAVSDDPGMNSSQNEQDSRLYGHMANVPVLEPSDSNEAYLLTKEGFRISEKFDTPVILRLTASISHTSSIVETCGKDNVADKEVFKEPSKYVMLPPFCNQRRIDMLARLRNLEGFSDEFGFNRVEFNSEEIGIITSGISYQYAKEAVPDASVLKISMTNPLPLGMIRSFSEKIKRIYVIEESGPFMEKTIRAEGINVAVGNERLKVHGELSITDIRDFFYNNKPQASSAGSPDDGTFCPGCPYLGVFCILRNSGIYIFGDIGCYTLAAKTFEGSIDTTLCMGAGISQAAGFLKSRPHEKAVAVIGDSTFFHSGIPALINVVHHGIPVTVIILNNRSTAMTGGQPYTGINIELAKLVESTGVRDITEVDFYDISSFRKILETCVSGNETSVIILNGECVIHNNPNPKIINSLICDLCGECLKIKCPSLNIRNSSLHIDPDCIGCGLCSALCMKGAIG